jgi:hypothetical protein
MDYSYIQCVTVSRNASQEVRLQLNGSSRPYRRYTERRPMPLDLTRISRHPTRQRTRAFVRPPTPYPYRIIERPRRRVAYVLAPHRVRDCGGIYPVDNSYSRDHASDHERQHTRKAVSFSDEILVHGSECDQVAERFSNLNLDPGWRKPRYVSRD